MDISLPILVFLISIFTQVIVDSRTLQFDYLKICYIYDPYSQFKTMRGQLRILLSSTLKQYIPDFLSERE